MADTVKGRFLATRHYIAVGLRHEGEVCDVPKDLAEQYVAQGFLEIVTNTSTKKPRPIEEDD